MISLGLRKKELQDFHRLLASPHVLTNSIYVLDLEERYLRIIRNRLLEGQVNLDADAEITRSCTMSLLDPEAQLNFDTDSPNNGALFMDRMIYVVQTFSEPPVHRTVVPAARNEYHNPSHEVNLNNVGSAVGAEQTSLRTDERAWRGSWSCKLTAASGNTRDFLRINHNSINIPAGATRTHRLRCYVPSTNSPTTHAQVMFRDDITGTTYETQTVIIPIVYDRWFTLQWTHTVPAGRTLTRVYWNIFQNATIPEGDHAYFDGWQSHDGAYADGDDVDWVWEGEPHASTSYRAAKWDLPEPKSYDVPIFRGPITKLDRSGDIINLEAQGKEVLTLGWMWKSWTYRKGWQKAAIIINLLWFGTGERRFQIKKKSARIGKRYSIGRELIPWKACKKLANSINKQLYYDARGWCKLRRIPSKSVFTFRTGRGGTVKTIPQAGYDLSSLKNVVWVKGRKPKAPGNKDKKDNKNQRKRRRPNYIATAGRSHPLSPYKLGRNGVGLRFVEEIEDDAIRSQAEARRFAKRRLRQLLLEHIEVQFESLPVPHLEPLDVCRIHTDDFAASFRIKKMSIPLTADASSTIGYTKRLRPNRARIRKRRR